MKALCLLFVFVSFQAAAQGNITPAQQQQMIEEASHRAPAAQDLDPEEARMIMENLKKAQQRKEAETKFLEDLDKED